MSFLISFNGQFAPYIHPTTEGWNAKIHPVHKLDPIDPKEIEYQAGHGPEILHHPNPSPVKSYEQQIKNFEKTKKRNYARDIMSSPVHFAHQKTSMEEAVELMKKFGFRHLPVIDPSENLVGLLSDREFIGAKPHVSCEELMVPKVLVAIQTARIQEIAQIMLQEKINALPIVNDQHQVVGIITQSDILKFVIASEVFSSLG